MTVHILGNFIVLLHWEIRPLASWPNTVTLSCHRAKQSLLSSIHAERQNKERQVSIV